jgi:transcriptional regulator with XRE-family HTH domain
MNDYEINLYKIIGSMLREARIKSGLTLEQAGEKIGVIAKTIQRYETGERKISINKLMELSSLFGINYTSFMSEAKKRLMESGFSKAGNSSAKVEAAVPTSDSINDQSAHSDLYYLDDEAREIAKQVYERPQLRMLFSASKNVSAEDLETVIALVKRMKKEDD